MPEHSQIQLHGWDSRAKAWHGPDELVYNPAGCRRILSALRTAHGSWYGKLRSQIPGLPPFNFAACVRDVEDAALGVLDLEGYPGGPLEIILVVPQGRLARIRADFAFEFVSFARFLQGRGNPGCEMAMHDYMEQVLRDTSASSTLVFSIETRYISDDIHLMVSAHAESLANGMTAWMAERDAAPPQTGQRTPSASRPRR